MSELRAKAAYLLSQSFHLVKTQRLYMALILACYLISFSLPLNIYAYRDSMFNPLKLESDGILTILTETGEQRETFFSCEAIREFLLKSGLESKLSIGVLVTQTTNTVTLDGVPMDGYFSWTLVDDGLGGTDNICTDDQILFGRQLSADRSCLVGERAFPDCALRDLPGKTLLINGEIYTISGVIPKHKGIFAALHENVYSTDMSLYLHIDENADLTPYDIADILEDEGFGVTSIRFPDAERAQTRQIVTVQLEFFVFFSWFGYLFCLISIASVLSSAMVDNRQRIYVKLALGGKRADIAIEYFLCFLGLSALASLLAVGGVQIISRYFVWIGAYSLTVTVGHWGLLLILSVSTSLFASLYAVIWIARKFP